MKFPLLRSLFIALIFFGFGTNTAKAQVVPDGLSCETAFPFCSDSNYVFPNFTGVLPGYGSIGCLGSSPNPVWYYFKIGTGGTMQLTMVQTSAASTPLDIDFAMWGPFSTLAGACDTIQPSTGGFAAPLQCSYSSSFTETIGLGMPGGAGGGASTPPNAIAGQIYVVLLTNFSNQPGTISFSQTAGTASTDCSILNCGITVTSNSPVCANDTLKLFTQNTNEPEYTYQYYWTGPNGWTSTSKNPVYAYPPVGTLDFHLDAVTMVNGNPDTCSEDIQVVVNPIHHTTISETICSGDSINFLGTFVSVADTYNTMLSTVAGCDSLVSLILTINPKPEQILMPDSIIACQYDTVAIESNTLPNNPNYTYLWQPSTGLNNILDQNVWFIADQSINYTLTVTNTVNGVPCTLSDTVHVIVNPGDFLQNVTKDTAICPGNSVQLFASGANSYKWSPPLYLSNPNIPNPVANAETTTTYELIGTSKKGCTDTQKVTITVHPDAVLYIPDSITIFPGEVYFLEPEGNCVYFQWFPDAGLSSTVVSNPKVNPAVNTRYFVTAKTEYGCVATDSIDVLVHQTVIDMPNAFTPNSGTFKAVKRGIAKLNYFRIFNRWGQKVFETTDIEEGWDGKLKGQPQPVGTYVYVIDAITIEGKPFKKSGSVTLIK